MSNGTRKLAGTGVFVLWVGIAAAACGVDVDSDTHDEGFDSVESATQLDADQLLQGCSALFHKWIASPSTSSTTRASLREWSWYLQLWIDAGAPGARDPDIQRALQLWMSSVSGWLGEGAPGAGPDIPTFLRDWIDAGAPP